MNRLSVQDVYASKAFFGYAGSGIDDVLSGKIRADDIVESYTQAAEYVSRNSLLFSIFDTYMLRMQSLIEEHERGLTGDIGFEQKILGCYREMIEGLKPYTTEDQLNETKKTFRLGDTPSNIWKLRIAAIEKISKYFLSDLYSEDLSSIVNGKDCVFVNSILRELARLQVWGNYNSTGQALLIFLSLMEKDVSLKGRLGICKDTRAYLQARYLHFLGIPLYYLGYRIVCNNSHETDNPRLIGRGKQFCKLKWHCGNFQGDQSEIYELAYALFDFISVNNCLNQVFQVDIYPNQTNSSVPIRNITEMQCVVFLNAHQLVIAGIPYSFSLHELRPMLTSELLEWDKRAVRLAVLNSIFRDNDTLNSVQNIVAEIAENEVKVRFSS